MEHNKISTLNDFIEFSSHKNQLFDTTFSNINKKTLSFQISNFIDLQIFNNILSMKSTIEKLTTLNQSTFDQHTPLFRKKNISKFFFNDNLFLFQLFFNIINNNEIVINNLLELAYFKLFKSTKGNTLLNFIPSLSFSYITIDKYSYLYNIPSNKTIKKDIKHKLKNKTFFNSLSDKDKHFFNLYLNTKFKAPTINPSKLNNDFSIDSKMYMIYQEYLILFSILRNTNKSNELKLNSLNSFFNTNAFKNLKSIPQLIELIKLNNKALFIDLYNKTYSHLNFNELSEFKIMSTDINIEKELENTNTDHKRNLLLQHFKY